MINQGSSEVSLVFGVLSEVENQILTALYEEFFTPITFINRRLKLCMTSLIQSFIIQICKLL